jgi:hypothetical protein
MPLYFSAHTTACLTKQALRQLMQELLSAREVKIRRCVSSQIGGRMLVEAEARDRETLETCFAARRLHSEWIMPIDLDAKPGMVNEY